MRHLVIGEGQIGRAITDRALADGDSVTVLRRSSAAPRAGVRRVTGDLLDPAALREAVTGADAIHTCFHAPYDARIWARDLPPRELAVLDAAAAMNIPVIFPESLYGFQGAAQGLIEGTEPAPRDAKGEVREMLLAQRRAHPARTLSIVAADLLGPTAVGTNAAVVCAMLIERIAAGNRPIVVGDPAAAHSLTFIPDLAVAMLFAVRHAERLAPEGDAVLHAPSAPARSQAELVAATSELLGERTTPPDHPPARAACTGTAEYLRPRTTRDLRALVLTERAAAGGPHHAGGPAADELGGCARGDDPGSERGAGRAQRRCSVSRSVWCSAQRPRRSPLLASPT